MIQHKEEKHRDTSEEILDPHLAEQRMKHYKMAPEMEQVRRDIQRGRPISISRRENATKKRHLITGILPNVLTKKEAK